ncbi:MAG TPA: siderophore-interacting protein [Micromonosporaceae bacterium]|nr:siderophore-interacting protein [Micromonosporaceae bacterium]
MSLTVPSPAGGDMTAEAFLARAPEVRLLNLRVEAIVDSGTATRTLSLGGDDLATFAYRPGQDVMVLADTSGGRIIRRRYTIRRFDPGARTLDLHVITDSEGPGAAWALALKVGDPVEVLGPRGKIFLSPDAAWHLFIGDDVALPAFSAMVEALPAGSRAIVLAEVAAPVDEVAPAAAAGVDLSVTWLHRHADHDNGAIEGEGRPQVGPGSGAGVADGDGRSAGTADALLAAVLAAPLPHGDGHAYVFGEAGVVSTVAEALRGRGLPVERISAKAYWGRGRANASHGEPLKTPPPA